MVSQPLSPEPGDQLESARRRPAVGELARRELNVIVAAGLLIVLIVLAWVLPVPFVQMRPGPAVDVLGSKNGTDFIAVTGHDTHPTTGRLDLTTVSVTAPGERLPLLTMLAGWMSSKTAIVPLTYVYPPTMTVAEVEQQNSEQMDASEMTAIAAGLRQAGVKVTEGVQIQAIAKGSPVERVLDAGDFVTAVGSTPVDTPEQLREAIRAHQPGEKISITYVRLRLAKTVTVATIAAADDPKVAAIGVTPTVGYRSTVSVSVTLPQQIGGPSAGMMFALALYDKLTPGPLTGGRTVAGTGTIGSDGKVGPIGGIQQKVVGARSAGATVFLAPAADCDRAGAARVDGITVYRVETLTDSVTVLTELNENKPVTVPVCGRS